MCRYRSDLWIVNYRERFIKLAESNGYVIRQYLRKSRNCRMEFKLRLFSASFRSHVTDFDIMSPGFLHGPITISHVISLFDWAALTCKNNLDLEILFL